MCKATAGKTEPDVETQNTTQQSIRCIVVLQSKIELKVRYVDQFFKGRDINLSKEQVDSQGCIN